MARALEGRRERGQQAIEDREAGARRRIAERRAADVSGRRRGEGRRIARWPALRGDPCGALRGVDHRSDLRGGARVER